jgi:hypothetical protein
MAAARPGARGHVTNYPRGSQAAERLEVVALDHHAVRRRLSFNLLEPRHRPARNLGDPECERRRVVLLGMLCSSTSRSKLARDGTVTGHVEIVPDPATAPLRRL